MLRISIVFSSVLCSSLLIMSQASYAETLSIGSGHTNTRELGGGTKYSRRRAKARRIKRQKRAAALRAAGKPVPSKQLSVSFATPADEVEVKRQATPVIEKAKALPETAAIVQKSANKAKMKARSAVVKPVKTVMAKTKMLPVVMHPKTIVKSTPAIAEAAKSVNKVSVKPAAVMVKAVKEVKLKRIPAVKPVVQAALTQAPIIKRIALPEIKVASITMITPPFEKPEEAGIQAWPVAKPKLVKSLHPVSEQRAIYEGYIKEIKLGKAFRATIERYSSDSKKTNMLRLFNQPKETQDMTIKQIQLSQKCTGLTFLKERQLSPYIVRISYAAKDICSKYSKNNRFEVVEMIRENNGWKVEKITVTNVID